MDGREEHYPDYPLFKGLQRPLEFMGIQGRYIYWAAATIGIAIVGFIIAYCLAGFVLALIVLAVTVTGGAGLILFKQRKVEKPLNFDPFGHARFAHLFVLYD